jgi:polysaccharide export outer membrane protein
MTKKHGHLLFTLALTGLTMSVLLTTSCITQKDLEYLKDDNVTIKAFDEADFPDYRLKPNDELFIQVSSLDDEAAGVFSNTKEPTQYIGSMQPYGASMLSYAIDKDGFLSMPVIGSIHVQDKTLSEVTEVLKDSLRHILYQPIISVKLVNRYVSVLGEVSRPGQFPYAQDKLSIYDALALAGDITIYGNRNEVILVRNENGENIRINVDLNSSEILASDYYHLRPNDMIYVKPMKKRFWGMDQFPYAIILSTITAGLLIFTIASPDY